MIGTPTSVQELLNDLTGGLRTGDNVVLQGNDESDADVVLAAALEPTPERAPLVYISFRLPPAEVHRRFASGWETERFLLIDCRAQDDEPLGNGVRVQRLPGASSSEVRSTLQQVTEELGPGTTYVFDGLTGMQQCWSPDEALSLFLWACPKLYEERTIAYWTLQRSAHTPSFLSELAQVTQVVIDLGHDEDRRWMELRKAHGRSEDLLDARIEFMVDGEAVQLLDRRPAGRQRVGRLIRQQRVAVGLSQAELARRVGVSPSALSQTERGRHGISGDVLIRVWEALGITLGDLDDAHSTHRVFPRSGRTSRELQPGVLAETILETRDLAAYLLECEPEASGARAFFTTKRRELALVLAGVLQLSIGRSEETLQQGDAIVVDEPVRGWRNPSDVPARVLWTLLD